jgi:hypothetical protein
MQLLEKFNDYGAAVFEESDKYIYTGGGGIENIQYMYMIVDYVLRMSEYKRHNQKNYRKFTYFYAMLKKLGNQVWANDLTQESMSTDNKNYDGYGNHYKANIQEITSSRTSIAVVQQSRR